MAEHELNKIVDDDGEVFNLRDSTKQPVADRVTAWGSTPSDTKYPSEKLVKDSLDGKVDFQYNDSSIGNSSPADECKAFFGDDTKNPARRVKLVYNDKGNENTIIFSRDNSKRYGTILKYGYNDRYLYLLRFKNNVWQSENWEKIHAGYADSAGSLTNGAIKERDIAWGGTFRTTKSPTETFTKQNSFFYPKPSAVSVEYSNNRTAETPTWTDYGLTDNEKRALFSGNEGAASVYCGKKQHVHPGFTGSAPYKDLSNENIADQGLRITIACRSLSNRTTDTGSWIYCYIRGILLYMSTQSAGNGAHCVIEKQNGVQYKNNSDEWVTLGDYKIQGDPGWNSIPYDGVFGGGWSQTSNYSWVIRFTIWSDQLNASPNSGQTGCLLISSIAAINHIVWSATNPVQRTGLPFSYGYDGTMTLMQALPLGSGGTGKTTAKAAEYNLTTGKSEISDTTSGDDRVVFELASPSESNGVTRGFRKLSTIWTWVKGQISSVLGLSESGYSGNAATASAAQSGSALETAINGKMNTSASNATAPSGSGGDGATATLLNNLTEGNSDIVTTDDGDNVLIATTDNGGSVTNKWYKRKLVKLIPWIIKKLGTRLVYDCGAGSTSGDDFDAALAAFNAGQWVIIRKDGIAYYCVGSYSGPGLRFKQIANDGSLLKVNTISWTRGSSPSVVTQIEASLSGHTHTRSDITNFAHTHGNIQDSGALQTSDVTIASGDKLVVTDSSDSGKVARASASFDGSTTTKALSQKGTFETFMTPSAGNASSGALQNLTAQLTEGTSDFTDNTEIFTSYAGNNGFAESGHVNQPYRRKASSMLNYVRDGFAIARSPADVGTTHKRISLGYGKYSSSNYVGAMTYIVRLFFNYADDGGLQGKGITVLVTYDFRRSGMQKSECRILSDNGVRDAGYNVVLANYVSGSGDNGKLYICIGLVKNSAPTTLVEFNYSYCKIFRVSTIGDWVEDISSDAVGTYNYIIQATDLVSNAVNADMVDGKHIVIGSWAGASNTIYFG